MLDGVPKRIDDERVVPLIVPPVSSPERDLEPLDVAHEVLLTVFLKGILEPEHLCEEVDLLHHSELPGLEFAEVLILDVIAERGVGTVALVWGSCFTGVEEVMFPFRDWEAVGFEIDTTTGQEEGDVDIAFAAVSWAVVPRVERPDGRFIRLQELLDGVEEDLISDFGGDGTIVEE